MYHNKAVRMKKKRSSENELAEVIRNIKQTEETALARDLNSHVGGEREEYYKWHGGKTFGH